MICQKWQENLLDGNWDKLRLDEAQTISRHLEECESCRNALANYDQIRSVLKVPDEAVEPPHGWDAFDSKIRRHAVSPQIHRYTHRLAVAASILVAFLMGGLSQQVSSLRLTPLLTRGERGVQPSPLELAQQVAAFRQVSDLLDGKAGWMALSDKASDVGVASGMKSRPRQLLLVRLVFSQKNAVVSQADVVIVPGQTAELTVPFLDDQQLRYQITTTTGEPTTLTLWVEAQSPHRNGEVVAALATNLQLRPGETRSAGQMVTSTGEYALRVAFSKANQPER